ncbi:MAG: DUF2703 domain-containing protein [Negativicutes bacterium]|nr:DUF2703 domain-containing protein [Negativicutes bacterium]
MIKPVSQACCSCGNACCETKPAKKKVNIEFLYLDLSVCERCQVTESNLDGAIKDLSAVLQAAGYEVEVSKINITSPELAIKHEFLSSPTIRVNGKDIAMEFKETLCEDCGDLCGGDTECRAWIYEGEEYSEPPKAMIIEAVMKEVFGNKGEPTAKEPYVLPENLALFFAGVKAKKMSKG